MPLFGKTPHYELKEFCFRDELRLQIYLNGSWTMVNPRLHYVLQMDGRLAENGFRIKAFDRAKEYSKNLGHLPEAQTSFEMVNEFLLQHLNAISYSGQPADKPISSAYCADALLRKKLAN